MTHYLVLEVYPFLLVAMVALSAILLGVRSYLIRRIKRDIILAVDLIGRRITATDTTEPRYHIGRFLEVPNDLDYQCQRGTRVIRQIPLHFWHPKHDQLNEAFDAWASLQGHRPLNVVPLGAALDRLDRDIVPVLIYVYERSIVPLPQHILLLLQALKSLEAIRCLLHEPRQGDHDYSARRMRNDERCDRIKARARYGRHEKVTAAK